MSFEFMYKKKGVHRAHLGENDHFIKKTCQVPYVRVHISALFTQEA